MRLAAFARPHLHMQAFTALTTRTNGHHPDLPWLTKAAKKRSLLQWHIYCAKPYRHCPVSHSLRERWEMRFHAGLQTISALKGCRLSDLSAQKLQIYFPLRETEPSVRRHINSEPNNKAISKVEPPAYPIPRDRSAKSASVVPTVVVAMIVVQ